jgi:glycosyltransferase involved in cell wall biosynthesis
LLLTLIVAFATAVFIQLIYWIIFLRSFSKQQPVRVATEPVSVIVCAHDEEDNLKELLPLLLQQDHNDFEIIVVNDRSNDNTYDYLLEVTKTYPRIKMVNVKDTPPHVNSKKYALTLGIRAATHDLILLTDADCRPNSTRWISSFSQSFDDTTQFVLGFSPYTQAPGFLNHFIRFESLVTALQYFSFAVLGNPYMGVGRNLAYRKSLFLEKKGFNNFLHVTGGDDDLFVNQHARGKNTKVHFSSDALMMSIPEKTLGGFFQQKLRHLSVGKRYRAGHKFLLGLFSISWIFTWVLGLTLFALSFLDYRVALIAAGGLFLRWVFQILSVHTIVKRNELTFKLWIIPVLDFIYPIYYISTGVIALFTTKVRWKT